MKHLFLNANHEDDIERSTGIKDPDADFSNFGLKCSNYAIESQNANSPSENYSESIRANDLQKNDNENSLPEHSGTNRPHTADGNENNHSSIGTGNCCVKENNGLYRSGVATPKINLMRRGDRIQVF